LYSQDQEEKFLLEHFKGTPKGRFLDIGAYDPRTLSNTRALYERNWSGVMVEPSPKHFLNLWTEYGGDLRVVLLLAAVAVERRFAEFYPTDGPVGTIAVGSYEKWKGETTFGPKFLVPTVTIAELVNAFGHFDFINIDAEGISVELFFQLPLKAMVPKAVCVEHNGERLVELGRFAQDNYYQQSWISQENAIYTPMPWLKREQVK